VYDLLLVGRKLRFSTYFSRISVYSGCFSTARRGHPDLNAAAGRFFEFSARFYRPPDPQSACTRPFIKWTLRWPDVRVSLTNRAGRGVARVEGNAREMAIVRSRSTTTTSVRRDTHE